jgi:uncharacterized protein YndB with AHSA1/START domain
MGRPGRSLKGGMANSNLSEGTMVDIIHRVGIKAPVAKVYAALSTVEGVAGWWTTHTSGLSKIGGTIEVRFHARDGKEIGHMSMEVKALDPNKKVQWRVAVGPEEWVGTDVVFNLSQDGEQTIVLFGHKHWGKASEFTAHCSMKWATFLLSLRELAETGKGKPSPDDLKIDNWN